MQALQFYIFSSLILKMSTIPILQACQLKKAFFRLIKLALMLYFWVVDNDLLCISLLKLRRLLPELEDLF